MDSVIVGPWASSFLGGALFGQEAGEGARQGPGVSLDRELGARPGLAASRILRTERPRELELERSLVQAVEQSLPGSPQDRVRRTPLEQLGEPLTRLGRGSSPLRQGLRSIEGPHESASGADGLLDRSLEGGEDRLRSGQMQLGLRRGHVQMLCRSLPYVKSGAHSNVAKRRSASRSVLSRPPMRTRWVIAAALFLGACLSSCFPKGWPPKRPGYSIHDFDYDVGPYLVRVGPRRVAVVVRHTLRDPPKVRWWPRPASGDPSPPDMREAQAVQLGDLWVAFLDGLPPDRELRYALESELGLIGPFEFRSDRSRQRSFRFAAIGDTRTGHEVHRVLVEKLAREDVDFFINSGDLVEFGGQEDQWIRFFNIEAPLMSRRPLFAAVGNHDNSQRLYFRRFFLVDLYAEGNRYFVQDWGDVRVIILDSEIEMRPGSDQHAFLVRALEDGAERGMILVLSLHYPPYSSGEHGSNPEMRAVLQPLSERYGVELVLAGHDHNYERTKPIGGVTYLVAASGGAPIRRVIPHDFTAQFRTEPHYVLFDVEAGNLVGRAVNLDGEVFDTFILPPNPPNPRVPLVSPPRMGATEPEERPAGGGAPIAQGEEGSRSDPPSPPSLWGVPVPSPRESGR